MSQEIVTYEKCPQCEGTGYFEPAAGSQGSGQLVCNWPGCTDGYRAREKTIYDPGLDDLMDKLNDIKEKVDDIKEVVDGL